MFNRLYLLVIPVVLLVLTGCGMKQETKDSLNKMSSKVVSTEKSVALTQKEFTNSKIAKTMAFYVKKENLTNNFEKASKEIAEAKKLLATAQALVKADKSDDENRVLRSIGMIRKHLNNATDLSNLPKTRLTQLAKIKKEAPSLMKDAKDTSKKLHKLVSFKISELDKAMKDFPLKKVDLTAKKDTLNKMTGQVDSNVAIAQKELDKDSKMDLSDFAKAIANVNKLDSDTKRTVHGYAKNLKELNSSYTKILADMKARHFVLVGRVSWDNYYDYPTEHKYVYSPREIPNNTIEQFYAVNGTIATYSSGLFGGKRVKMPSQLWSYLRINMTESFPSGDDEAEYWIEDIKSKYYHKYIIVENGVKKETGFVEVSENEFFAQEANLGMALVSKPYGYYESEADRKAAPPGLAFVGNPKYGEWKQDSSGNSFFHYYGMYSMFTDLTGSRYSRSYYDDYDRNYRGKKNYYSGGYGTYGTRTYSKGSRFSKSSFARTNSGLASKARKGGFKGVSKSGRVSSTGSRSVRSAGSSSRGRGPGGGGK